MVLPLSLPFMSLGWANRARLVKENKALQQQLMHNAKSLQDISNPFSNLLPKLGVAGVGLAGAKVASDTISSPKQRQQMASMAEDLPTGYIPRYNYAANRSTDFSFAASGNGVTANFFDPLTMLMGLENGAASLHWNLKNGKLRNTNKMLEQELLRKRANSNKTLGAIGIGTAALATPALAYMNGRKPSNSNQYSSAM
jgi:hypothetical protein